MVVLVDLDDDPTNAGTHTPPAAYLDLSGHAHHLQPHQTNGLAAEATPDERPNPNINSFSAALSCYPVVSQIAQHIDLNSLHDLAATCRQFYANLVQFRAQLVKQTLRCVNEETEVGHKLAVGLLESHQAWVGATHSQLWDNKISSGRVGKCARDMVGECRRCGTVVCRNCTIKSPPVKALSGRHRRLCRTCIKAPLRWHTSPLEWGDRGGQPSFTSEAFARTPCVCPEIVFICLFCGNAMRSADVTYMRGWTWRTRYSTYLGGLGTGIGEGNEGVECGKGDQCLAAKEVEKEIDCEPEALADLKREIEKVEREGRQWGGTSYLTQEIEGIGGVVKKKVKRRVKVGQVVKEYEDERETGDYLGREQRGVNRSWCHWCARIIPGNKDKQPQVNELSLTLEQSNSSSSSIKSHIAPEDEPK